MWFSITTRVLVSTVTVLGMAGGMVSLSAAEPLLLGPPPTDGPVVVEADCDRRGEGRWLFPTVYFGLILVELFVALMFF